MKLLTTFTLVLGILSSSLARASDWNQLLQDCEDGNKGQWQKLSVEEKGFRFGHLFSGLEFLDGSAASEYTTVELTATERNGTSHKFKSCEMMVLDEAEDDLFVMIHDCSKSGNVASPTVRCWVRDEEALSPARVNDGRTIKEISTEPAKRSGAGATQN